MDRVASLCLFAALGGACERAPREKRGLSAAMARATFDVPGMTCASCNVTVKLAAEGVDGVAEARADFEKKRAWVEYDPGKTTPAVIAAAITRSGYEAKPIEEGVP